MTPDQARQLVAHFGSQRAAARAVGVWQSTVWNWLHPEGRRKQARRASARYIASSPLAYNRKLLLNRRYAALSRMAQREQRRAVG